MAADSGASFKQATIQKILKNQFKDEKTKIGQDTLKLTCEVLRIFAREGAARAAQRAKHESSPVVDIEHFEKILPQLLLDF
ncbi:centromere protein X-like [Tubulanus polymorphus]|uniref:centromere protein X-like n=1 Tax=Tubulanus polymorphus TaxID=672921 RepID=UPI003DA587C2